MSTAALQQAMFLFDRVLNINYLCILAISGIHLKLIDATYPNRKVFPFVFLFIDVKRDKAGYLIVGAKGV